MSPKTMRYPYDPEQSAGNLIPPPGPPDPPGRGAIPGRKRRGRDARAMGSFGKPWRPRPGATQASLADPLLKDHANITRMLDGLQRRGLIRRRPNPGDRRSFHIHLTDAGQELVDGLLPGVLEQKAHWFRGMDQAQLDQLVELLQLLEANIRDADNG